MSKLERARRRRGVLRKTFDRLRGLASAGFGGVRDRLVALKREVEDRIARLAATIKRLRGPDWPDDLVVAELLYHLPGPHVHLASPERDKLIRIGKIAEERGLRVGEFPPFDVVEDVHVDGSWHYRDSSNPSVPRNFENRGDGLAMDLNDVDGGSDQEQAFYAELLRRYG